ncbi:MAG: iron-siderophore ABC transporter substrate-binding protein [Cyanobacteria bacterium J06639_16]
MDHDLTVRRIRRIWWSGNRRIKQFFLGAIAAVMTVCLFAACMNPSVEPEVPSSVDRATRSMAHAMGVVDIPNVPERVVVLDTAALDAALALETKPIGAAVYGEFADYLGDRTAGITLIGDIGQPNLEAILALEPDLILSNKVGSEDVYPKLAKIAPTIFTEGSGADGNWPDNLRLYGEALGKRDRAEQLILDYQQRIATLKQQLRNPQETVVSVVFTHEGYVGFYTDTSFSGAVLADLGLVRPPIQTQSSTAPYLDIVSKEAFHHLDGDIIFLLTGANDDTQLTLEDFVKDPLYSQLSAVQAGKIYAVQSAVWSAGRNILAARQILSDIAKVLTE